MIDVKALAVLDVSILTDMYGDDSTQTVHHALSGFLQEATTYISQLQQQALPLDYSSIARLSHSLKSMAGLVGACQLQLLCDSIEQSARQHDQLALSLCWPKLSQVWAVLHTELTHNLQQYGHFDA